MKNHFFQSLVLIIGLSFFLASDGNAQIKKPKVKVPEKSTADQADVEDVLARIKITKVGFQGATKCISNVRDVLFDIAATNEKKEQLKAKKAELAAAESDEDKERIIIEIEKVKDEEIDRAMKSGELENKKLNQQQLKNVAKSIWNSSLAILLDKLAVDNGPKIISDGKTAIESAQKDRMKAAKMAGKINELRTAISEDMPDIVKEAPHQIKTLGALFVAANTLKKNNPIEDFGEPKADDKFEEIKELQVAK